MRLLGTLFFVDDHGIFTLWEDADLDLPILKEAEPSMRGSSSGANSNQP